MSILSSNSVHNYIGSAGIDFLLKCICIQHKEPAISVLFKSSHLSCFLPKKVEIFIGPYQTREI